MALNHNFKVIIAGGSVAGLSLAKMLEELGIDFVLLEAFRDIAPQVGASIGLMGNGLRILDQLGCYDEVCANAPDSLQSSVVRSAEGVLVQHFGLDRLIRERIGYPFVFMDRQTLLQVLYNNIKQKSNILTSKRIIEVQLVENGDKVLVEDKSEYTGNILIGADGIRSTVRERMWTLADKFRPGKSPRDEWHKIRCEYACIFGISAPTGRWKGGDTTSVYGDGYSYFIVGGPQDRVYWFLFFNIGVPKTGKDIPRFTKADEMKLAHQHRHDIIDDEITFADLYKTRTTTVLTSLEEVVFSTWYFKRIMTIGDAAHKLHPLGGQGGNCAIETGAMLANSLARTLKIGDWSENALEMCFERVQNQQQQRLTKLMESSHRRARLECLDGIVMRFLALNLIPQLGKDMVFDRLYASTSPGGKLDGFKVPKKPKQAPFEDELPRKPQAIGIALWVIALAFLFLEVIAFKLVYQVSPLPVWTLHGPPTTPYNSETLQDFPSALLLDTAYPASKLYFATTPALFICIWFVKECLSKQLRSFIYMTFTFVLCQRFGFSLVAPLLYLHSILKSTRVRNLLPLGRQFSGPSRAPLVAVALGYIIPVTLYQLYVLSRNAELYRIFEVLSRPWHLYKVLLITLFFQGFAKSDVVTSESAGTETPSTPLRNQKDYLIMILVGSVSHIGMVLSILSSQSHTIYNLFFESRLGQPLRSSHEDSTYANIFTLLDMLLLVLETVFWLICHTWILAKAGVFNISGLQAIALSIIGSILIGPGGVTSLLWYWQDSAVDSIVRHII